MPRLLGALVALLIAAACGSDTHEQPAPMVIHGAASFPHESLADWVSYAEQVSVVTITDDREIRDPSLKTAGEGYVGRQVTARVEETLWLHPGEEGEHGEFDFVTAGWVVRQDGSQTPTLLEGAIKLEIGDQYLIPLATVDGVLGPLAPAAVLQIESGIVQVDEPASEAHKSLDSKALSGVRVQLQEAKPDPIAEKYMDLSSYERARAVVEEKADS